jgi:DNA polymerase (family 10)
MDKILDACARHGVIMECNSYPERLDLKDVYLRMCKERGVKVVISTDAHRGDELSLIHYGVTMSRRAWLTPSDVVNTLPVTEFLAALRPKPTAASSNAAPSRSAAPKAQSAAAPNKKSATRKTSR